MKPVITTFTFLGHQGSAPLTGSTISDLANSGVFGSPPKIVKEPPPTIDQLCTAALSRLRVAAQANADWELIQFHKRCRDYDRSINE